jgi:hypothetical protein
LGLPGIHCDAFSQADVSKVNSSTTQQIDAFQPKLLELESRIINLERRQG